MSVNTPLVLLGLVYEQASGKKASCIHIADAKRERFPRYLPHDTRSCSAIQQMEVLWHQNLESVFSMTKKQFLCRHSVREYVCKFSAQFRHSSTHTIQVCQLLLCSATCIIYITKKNKDLMSRKHCHLAERNPNLS